MTASEEGPPYTSGAALRSLYLIPFNGTLRYFTWREADCLPYAEKGSAAYSSTVKALPGEIYAVMIDHPRANCHTIFQ